MMYCPPKCSWCGEREVIGMYSDADGIGYCSGLCWEEAMTEMDLARKEWARVEGEEIEPEWFGAEPEEPDDNMTDAEADADTLASAGWGTDEDYGYFGGDDA